MCYTTGSVTRSTKVETVTLGKSENARQSIYTLLCIAEIDSLS